MELLAVLPRLAAGRAAPEAVANHGEHSDGAGGGQEVLAGEDLVLDAGRDQGGE